MGEIKCNVDVGFFEVEGVPTAASCFRDHHGKLIPLRERYCCCVLDLPNS